MTDITEALQLMKAAAVDTRWAKGMISGRELCAMEVPPLKYIVPKIIPEGLTILAGRPKFGKSWLVLHLGIVLSKGGKAIDLDYGTAVPLKGAVLYLALEDGERRLKWRMAKLIGSSLPESWPEAFDLKTEWRALDEGGLKDIRDWYQLRKDQGANPILVVFDRPSRAPPLAGLQKLAQELGIAIIVNHHDRKLNAEDIFDTISGTLGRTGTADTILVLTKKAGTITLHVRGRDIEEETPLAMSFDQDCRWSVIGKVAELERTGERGSILKVLAGEDEGLTATEIKNLADIDSKGNADRMLARMAKDGEIERIKRGVYGLPGTRDKIDAKLATKVRSKPNIADTNGACPIGPNVRTDDKPLAM
jgi:hypothetical protein